VSVSRHAPPLPLHTRMHIHILAIEAAAPRIEPIIAQVALIPPSLFCTTGAGALGSEEVGVCLADSLDGRTCVVVSVCIKVSVGAFVGESVGWVVCV
jgi:hypothetical protein